MVFRFFAPLMLGDALRPLSAHIRLSVMEKAGKLQVMSADKLQVCTWHRNVDIWRSCATSVMLPVGTMNAVAWVAERPLILEPPAVKGLQVDDGWTRAKLQGAVVNYTEAFKL